MAAGSALRCHDVRLRRRGRRRYDAARRRGRRRHYCDRMRGSLRSGDVSLREGRDSSRPRLYLRSVATSATLPLTTIRCPLPSTFLHFYTAIFATARRRRYGCRCWRGRRRHDCDRMRGSRRSGDVSLQCRTTARQRRYGCDRMCGSLRSGDMSLREGRDSSRPRLCLRSVATSATLPLPTAIYISTLLHGHFCDGEATSLQCRTTARAPSLRVRPHVRLTSFGGYVAVGIAVAARPAAWHVATAPSPSQVEWLRRGCYCA